jgi:hypothetical protein
MSNSLNLKQLEKEIHFVQTGPEPEQPKVMVTQHRPVAAFTMCGDPYGGNRRHHRGHARCVKARKREEAAARQMAAEKEKRNWQRVDAANAPGRTGRSVVPSVPSETSLQRKGKARKRVRNSQRSSSS